RPSATAVRAKPGLLSKISFGDTMAARRPPTTRRPMSSPSELSDSSTRPSRTSIPKDIERKATASAASAPAARAAFTSRSARSVSGMRSSNEEEEASIGWLSDGCKCHRFNRRWGQFPYQRQHLVNHALQRRVNHSWQRTRRYFRLTQNIKWIRTPFCHHPHATRHKKSGAGEFRGVKCEVADAP